MFNVSYGTITANNTLLRILITPDATFIILI